MKAWPVTTVFDQACISAPRYRVVVRPYLLGQFRIQLLDGERPFDDAIIREMCTYDRNRMQEVVDVLCSVTDPLAYCEALAKPWNCDYRGGRIRLDNRPQDRPEMVRA